MEIKNYWGYRIDTKNIPFFWDELSVHGRLRQGWGWDNGQNLKNMTLDEGTGRNRAMLRVKKGDILLIPQLPGWGEVAIAEATEDWDAGYKFDIPEQYGDYGHIFPAKYLKSFTRYGEAVSGNIRSTLHNPSRFWSISHFADDIETLLAADDSKVSGKHGIEERVEQSIKSVFREVFRESDFSQKLFAKINHGLTRAEWEPALVLGLKTLFPFYQVEKVGGPSEVNHGTDILVRLPGIISDYGYAIAIQVKDYTGKIDNRAVEQVNKADRYFANDNTKLIDKFVIYTNVKKEDNLEIAENCGDVRLIFTKDLEDLLMRIGKKLIGINEFDDGSLAE